MPPTAIAVEPEQVIRLWLQLQGYAEPRGHRELTRESFVQLLEQVGGLQLDSINALERAHYVTLWSRFGPYDKAEVDRWIYDERLAYEYWGHEASVLPISHLPLGMRRMRRFPPPRWKNASFWSRWNTSPASKRRVMARLRADGPLERRMIEDKEDKRSLLVLWHTGKVAITRRHHFRRVYDLASRVYPEATPASAAEYDESWLLIGLRGNGIASEEHLTGYWTGPAPAAAARRKIISRLERQGKVRAVTVRGFEPPFYALPEHLDRVGSLPTLHGTTLLSPFDSLLWQRRRAEDLLNFRYRAEFYLPEARREFGYYTCPILHQGRLVGRVDPKFHRGPKVLEFKRIGLESGVEVTSDLRAGLRESFESLAAFVGARDIQLPPDNVVAT